MIYIIGDGDGFPKSVYSGKEDDTYKYKLFMLNSASKINVIINHNYYNIMNKSHHEHLDDETYIQKCKEWNAYLKTFTFEWFLRTQKRKQLDFRLV